MPHDKEYVIRLGGLDLGQVIDGLDGSFRKATEQSVSAPLMAPEPVAVG